MTGLLVWIHLAFEAASFGSMALGSICVHSLTSQKQSIKENSLPFPWQKLRYMQPEMNSDTVANDFEKEAKARTIVERPKEVLQQKISASGGRPSRK